MSTVEKETSLKLLPLESPIDSSEQRVADKPEQDAWLTNANTSLVDSLYQPQDKKPETTKHNRLHHCQQLIIHHQDGNYTLETEQGTVTLEDGDIIALAKIQFLVSLQTQTVSVPDTPAVTTERKAIPDSEDDIWSVGEVYTSTTHVADPFAGHRVTPVKPTASPSPVTMRQATSTPTLPNIPSQPQYGMVESSDPLGFLYPASQQPTPAQYPMGVMPLSGGQDYLPTQALYGQAPVSKQQQANVLHDLGINEQTSRIATREYSQHQATYGEQSPMDMLDDYLTIDDMTPVQHQSMTQAVQTQPAGSTPQTYYAPTIHDDEPKKGLLGSVKQFLSRKKESV